MGEPLRRRLGLGYRSSGGPGAGRFSDRPPGGSAGSSAGRCARPRRQRQYRDCAHAGRLLHHDPLLQTLLQQRGIPTVCAGGTGATSAMSTNKHPPCMSSASAQPGSARAHRHQAVSVILTPPLLNRHKLRKKKVQKARKPPLHALVLQQMGANATKDTKRACRAAVQQHAQHGAQTLASVSCVDAIAPGGEQGCPHLHAHHLLQHEQRDGGRRGGRGQARGAAAQ